ncbi:hypothetical protein LguiA_029768 [Lonicera macranthoides]
MAMPPERSRPLHNFTLPRLKWGNQRFLRCMNSNNANDQTSSAANCKSPVLPHSIAIHRRRPGTEAIQRRSPNATESFQKSPIKQIRAQSSDSDQDRDGILISFGE